MTVRRAVIAAALAVLVAAGCQSTPALPAPPVAPGPPTIPDAQSAVDAPLFVGQSTFASPLKPQTDFVPSLATVRADGGNSGVVDGPAPLGRAPVTGSAAVPILPPLLWGRRGGLTAGCQIEIVPGLTKSCLAAVDTATLTVDARWLPPGQDLNAATAVIDDNNHILVTTRQRHLFVVARPDTEGATFRVVRDIDLNGHVAEGQGLLAAIADANGNLWFTSGGTPPVGEPSTNTTNPTNTTSTTVGYVTSDDQVVTITLPDQRAEVGFAVDQGNVYLVTAPAGAADHAGALGQVYDLVATTGQVQTLWRSSFDVGSSAKPGAANRGTGSPAVLLGGDYLALTDNADDQSHLLVFLRGPLPTSTTTTTSPTSPTSTTTPSVTTTTLPATTAPATVTNPRLVCSVALFSPGASAVISAPIGYSSDDANSVIAANGYDAPTPLPSPSDDGPANNMNQMAAGLTRVDVLPDGTGCRAQWTAPVRLKTAPVLSSTTGLIYGYTQDEARAAGGSYIWYFVAMDYRNGRVVWRQRAGAGSTKNDDRLPTIMGANGVLYQTVPLGLVWMRDVAQRP